MPTDVQPEAKALGHPPRHRLFRYIADAPAPVTVAELTGYVRLNHNAVRQHLSVLKDARLVVEEAERRDRPGRPRLLYRLHPEVAGRWDTPGAYAWLASLLSTALRRGLTPRQAGRQEGHRRAAELAGPPDPVYLPGEGRNPRGVPPVRGRPGASNRVVVRGVPVARRRGRDRTARAPRDEQPERREEQREVEAEAEGVLDSLEDLHALAHDLGSRAVAREEDDLVCHRAARKPSAHIRVREETAGARIPPRVRCNLIQG